MASRLFYAWLPEGANADAQARAEVAIAGVRSASVTTGTVAGGYSINVEGVDTAACEVEVHRIAARLQRQGLLVGRRAPAAPPAPPAREPAKVTRPAVARPAPLPRKNVLPAPAAAPSPPPAVEPTAAVQPKQATRPSAPATPPPTRPAGVAKEPRTTARSPQAARLLAFMQGTFMHEPTLGFLTNRLQLGSAAVRRHMEILIDQGLVEEVAPRTYRLTEQGQQAK